ncbi:GemA protein [Desulfuromonas versatilis]|uniref:GemA protein n=1 Tax=Desulfuromonas versatilis TaxID=2802975 RepID=A0ABN6DTI9_9BACT|nr:regulatory protein GemA [Desulfuromonas versatilis]BCR03468.1 GemA protein [Desulfuromonas versatilis]
MDEEYRRRALAKIHIAKKELELDEPEYREMIAAVAPGKESSGDLNEVELHQLLDRFHELGWRPRIRRAQKRPFVPMVWKARNLWLELHRRGQVRNPSWAALGRFAKRMTGVGDLRQLNERQAGVVIEALKQWLNRPPPSPTS